MARVSLAVYTRAGAQVATTDLVGADAKARWWSEGAGLLLDELDDTGSFSVNVQADATDIDAIEAGHILVVSLDTVPIWRGVIRRSTRREIAEDEAGRYSTFVGTGEVGRLDEMVVYPTGGLGRFPFSDDVSFNWTHPSFDDSAWVAAVETPANYGQTNENYGLPEGFPWGDAEWIWDQDSSGTVPGGIKYMRLAVNVAEYGVYQAWSAADDRNEVWCSGKSILKSSDAPYDGRTTAVELVMTAGWAQLAAKVENRNDLKAGFLFGIGDPLDTTVTPFGLTSTSWVIAPDGATLGMNAGQIMDICLDDYEDQLTAAGITPVAGVNVPTRTWTSLLDSNGDPWTTYEELTVQAKTTTFLDVLRQMVELEMCDFRMSPTAFTLNLYNAGNAGTTVAYTLDSSNLTSLVWDTIPAVATSLLVRYDRGYTDVVNAGLVAAHGLRQSGLDLGGISAESTAESQAAQVIDRFGDDRSEIAAGVEPEDAASEPFSLYGPGDWISAPTPSSLTGWGYGTWGEGNWGEDDEDFPVRVMAVGMGVDEVGAPVWAVHLNTHIEEAEKRQQLLLKKLAGSVGGRSTTTTIPYEPRPITPREPEPLLFSQDTDTGIEVRESGPHRFHRAVRIREVHVELSPTSSSGDVVVVAKKNGVTFATVTVTAGRLSSYETTSTVFQQRSDVLTIATTSVGTGVLKITTKVVFA